MIYIGDCHGKTNKLTHMLLGSRFYNKRGFQLGDMGLGFKGVLLREFPREYFLFIRGNHDDPEDCQRHPNYAGDYGYIPEEQLFFLGGAWSIDKDWRIPGVSWWPDEELSWDHLKDAVEVYKKYKPLIVATHEAPTRAAEILVNQLTLGPKPARFEPGYKDTTREKGQDYDYYKAKLGCANTRTSQALQYMLDAWGPKHWVFGHYHVRMDFELQGCQFHCLPELDTLEINLNQEDKCQFSSFDALSTLTK